MFRKSKIEPVEKVKIVERYLAGEIGIQQAGKELGVDHHSIRNWISIYQYDGPTGLLNQPKNKSYSKDLKISAINDYLNGEGSLQDICTKYGIRSHRQLSDWIKVYNSGGILKTSTGGAYMKKAILKREMYYKQRFNDRSSLITAIANYIDYYNNQRLQRKLHVMTPMKYHEQYTKAA